MLKQKEIDEQIERLLERMEDTYGEVPELYSSLAEISPHLLLGCHKLEDCLDNKLFSSIETQLIMLSFSKRNEGSVCESFHHQLLCLHDIEDKDIQLMKKNELPETPKLRILVKIANELVNSKGKLSQETLDQFLSFGYEMEHVFRMIHILSIKTITNFSSNSIAGMKN